MANDGSRWVVTADISERDVAALEKLWQAREEILNEAVHKDFGDCFNTGDKLVWYNACPCAQCVFIVERLDVAQAELETAYKSVAITSEISDGSMAVSWQRVRAWFEGGQKKGAAQLGQDVAKRSGPAKPGASPGGAYNGRVN